MSATYNPTSWNTTTAINPTHLNNIESGIANATNLGNANETAISSLGMTVVDGKLCITYEGGNE